MSFPNDPHLQQVIVSPFWFKWLSKLILKYSKYTVWILLTCEVRREDNFPHLAHTNRHSDRNARHKVQQSSFPACLSAHLLEPLASSSALTTAWNLPNLDMVAATVASLLSSPKTFASCLKASTALSYPFPQPKSTILERTGKTDSSAERAKEDHHGLIRQHSVRINHSI